MTQTKIHTADAPFPKQLYHPKHWPSWLVAAVLYTLVKTLPYAGLMALGGKLGWLMEKTLKYRLIVAKTNIDLCFADDKAKAQQIYRDHVTALGKGVFEMAMGWFLPPLHFANRLKHVGHEVVDNALAEGRGVLFLGIHTTSLDFAVAIFNSRYPTSFMYRPANNAVLDYIMLRARLRGSPVAIEQRNLREILTRLKAGQCIWYGSDQDFGNNAKSVFAPFFGVSAYTLPYYAHLARKTNAAVIPVAGFRDDASGEFIVRYLPAIDVNGLDDVAAATAMNDAIAELLQGYEAQYYWVHRRFKTRPEGEEAVYPRKPSHLRRQRKAARRAKKAKTLSTTPPPASKQTPSEQSHQSHDV